MNFRSVTVTALACVCAISCISVCGCTKEQDKFYGQWAYEHEPEVEGFNFKSGAKLVTTEVINKTTVVNKYTYTFDDEFLELTDENGNISKMRYDMQDDGQSMYIYKNVVYTKTDDTEPNGLIGVWKCEELNLSFEFLDNGEFREDEIFPGYYTVDTPNSTFKLVYTDMFEDCVCYYDIREDELHVEYPWKIVRMD